MMTLDEGAERLHRLTKELLRRYQFRDWNQVCCYGISISQSHILDVLAEEGDLTMQELARRMFKSVSTMTRVAGQLVRKGYIKRRQDPEDRRIVHVSITPQGKAIIAAIQRDLIETQKAVLQSVQADEWAGAFKVLEALSRGARRWQETCCKVWVFFELMIASYNRKKDLTGGAMLKPKQDQLANEFYRAAFADGEVDAKTKILIGAAVSMTVGCYPWMRYYLGVAKENGISEGAIRETMAVTMAVNSGRVRMQAREALKGMLEPLASA